MSGVVVEPARARPKSAIFAKNVDMPNATGAYDAHNRRTMQMYAAGIAHATDPFEVAEVIQFLLSDTGSIISGAVLPVYGKA